MRQNLLDAGCSQSQADTILSLHSAGMLDEAKQWLLRHRLFLMEELHTDQRRLDCLDYLLRNMDKEERMPSQ